MALDTGSRNVKMNGLPPDRVILFIIGTIVVLFGAYYVTYFIGMKATGQTRAGLRNRNIKILDRYAIARDKQFCIIEIAGKVYVIGVTNHSMALLDTFDAATFAKLTEGNEEITPWNMTPVGQYGNKLTKKLVAFIAEKTGRVPQGSKTGEADFAESLREAQRTADDACEESGSVKPDDTKSNNPENPEDD